MITFVGEMDVYCGVAVWTHGFGDEFHAGLMRCSSAFFDITFQAGTNDIVPCALSAERTRYNVIEREVGGVEFFAAILATAGVTGENVAAVEFYLASWETIVK